MKKLLSLILALAIVMTLVPAAFAASTLDLAPVKENSTLFTITESSTTANVAYIETALSSKDRAFVHAHESSRLYSTTQCDILVLDYGLSTAYPVMRLWVNYSSDDAFLDISGVDIIFNGKKYAFTDVTVDGGQTHDTDGYSERVLIKMGVEELDFVIDLREPFNVEGENATDIAKRTTATMVLYGAKEDVTVELGYGFFIDFLLITTMFTQINGLDYIEKTISTPVKMSEV